MQHKFRLLTFNTKQLPPLFGGDIDRAVRICDAIKRRSYDVVCLQEVVWEKARHVFVDRLRKAGLTEKVPKSGGGGWPWRQDSGLFFATRGDTLSIEDSSFHGFPWVLPTKGADVFAEKGVLSVELSLTAGNERFRVFSFSTHMESVRHSARKRQLDDIASFMTSLTCLQDHAATAVLLCGDFNIDATSGQYADVREILGPHRDLFAESNPGSDGFTIPSKNPRRRIDYWLVFDQISDGHVMKDLWTVTVDDATVDCLGDASLSDHLPVEVVLSLSE